MAAAVKATSDGGSVVAGYTASFGAGDWDLWLVKLDAAGSVLWQKAYGGPGADIGRAVDETRDGGLVVAGATGTFGRGWSDLWVIKTGPDGSPEWQRAYGGPEEDGAGSVSALDDGGFLVAGVTASFGSGPAGLQKWVLKLDAAGDIQWQRLYGADLFQDIVATSMPGGGSVIAGPSHQGGHDDAWIARLDDAGDILWQYAYDIDMEESVSSIQPTTDGGLIAASSSNSLLPNAPWVLKLDGSGLIEWEARYVLPRTGNGGHIRQTDDGYVLATLTYQDTSLYQDAAALKLDGSGAVQWATRLGGPIDEWNFGMANPIDVDPAGRLLLAGDTQSFGAGEHDAWLVALSPDGSLGASCTIAASVAPIVIEHPPVVVTPTLRVPVDTTCVPIITSAAVTSTCGVVVRQCDTCTFLVRSRGDRLPPGRRDLVDAD